MSKQQTDGSLGTLTPIVRSSVAEAVYRSLRDRLMHGEYAPGQTLGIQAVAQALGTSTMPVREAFRRLIMQQGLEPMKNGSTRVPLITRDGLEDIRRARVLIEGNVTEWAAPRLGHARLEELESLAAKISALRRSPEGITSSLELNLSFHFTIYDAAESPVMTAIIESLWLQSGPYLRATRELFHTDELPSDHLHEHTIRAIRSGQFAEARKFIETDICWVFDRLTSDGLIFSPTAPNRIGKQ